MIKVRGVGFLGLIFSLIVGIVSGSVAFADTTSSVFGLPVSVVTPPSEVVGHLSYSNQWISEKTTSYLYMTYNSAQLESQNMAVGQYVSNFGSSSYGFPSIDFFSHLFSFANAESSSALRDFALWGRYSLGFADRSGHVSSLQSSISNPVDTSSMLLINARIGASVGSSPM